MTGRGRLYEVDVSRIDRMIERRLRAREAEQSTPTLGGRPGFGSLQQTPVQSPGGTLAHTGLSDMPSASNSDHDGRYYTEAEIGSTGATPGASLVGINDAGGYFTGTTVEAALQELASGSVSGSGTEDVLTRWSPGGSSIEDTPGWSGTDSGVLTGKQSSTIRHQLYSATGDHWITAFDAAVLGLAIQIDGDSDWQFKVNATGAMSWGSGGATPDTQLSRISANLLGMASSDAFLTPTLYGSIASGGDLLIQSSTHATKGNIRFGSADGMSYDEANARLALGADADVNTFDLNGSVSGVRLLVKTSEAAGADRYGMGLHRISDDNQNNYYLILRSRGTVGAEAVLASGDPIGGFIWGGCDGTDQAAACALRVIVDPNATPGDNDMPSCLQLFMVPDGSQTLTHALAVNRLGYMGLGTAQNVDPVSRLHVSETTGGIVTIGRADTGVAANDLLGQLQFHSNDSTLTTQQLGAYIAAHAAQNYITDAAATYLLFAVCGTGAGTSPVAKLRLEASALSPAANDGTALGTTALQFSDLFLAEGGVINWDNGDATLTQVGDAVTLAGAALSARITPRTATEASSATPTINTDTTDYYSLTALATNITSMTTNLSGTPTPGQELRIGAVSSAGARTITWGASWENGTLTLPPSVAGVWAMWTFRWNESTSKWRIINIA